MPTPQPEHITRPEFAVAVRGYDRTQVDAYFGRVLEWLADAENRAIAAERAREVLAREAVDLRATVAMLEERAGMPAPKSMSAFSERMSQVMQSAMEAAQELRAEAEREARRQREEVAAETEQLLERAHTEAERIVEHAREAQRAMEASIAELRGTRKEAVDALVQLQQRIAEVAGQAEPSEIGPALDGAEAPDDPGAGESASGSDRAAPPDGRDADETVMIDAIQTDAVDGLPGDPARPEGVYVTSTPTRVLPVVDAAKGAEGTGKRRTERVDRTDRTERVASDSRKRRTG